jgi:hypothetical protein
VFRPRRGPKREADAIENLGNTFEHYELTSLGFGPRATGEYGWLMSSGFFFRCHACGYLMQGGTTDESCTCGALQRESIGRFGSRFGDDAIEVFEARPRATGQHQQSDDFEEKPR